MHFRTVSKISVLGSSYLAELTRDHIDVSQLPSTIGGEYPSDRQEGEPFEFDFSEGGLLWIEKI
jgi:hypothetical protein